MFLIILYGVAALMPFSGREFLCYCGTLKHAEVQRENQG
jgi:hypothetical protein